MFTRSGERSRLHPVEIHRCVICNSINHEEASSETGGFTRNGFYEREVDGQMSYVCFECESWHDELMGDYYIDEEEDVDQD